MSDKPLLSFVVPTRNRLEWIGECLQSLLSQTISDVEVVIVDDASDDGTRTLLEWFARRDPRVQLLSNETRLGGGLSRNKGNNAARAEIIAVCDDDDVYPIERAEKTLDWFKKNPEGGMFNAPYVQVGYFNEIKEPFHGMPFDEERFKLDGAISYFAHPTAAYFKKDILEIPYKAETEQFTDDYQLLKDWIAAGKKIGFQGGDFLCMHRVLPKSMMAQKRGFDPRWVSR